MLSERTQPDSMRLVAAQNSTCADIRQDRADVKACKGMGWGGWWREERRRKSSLAKKLGQLLLLRARERLAPAQASSVLPSQEPQASPDKAPPPPRRLSRSSGGGAAERLGAWQSLQISEHPPSSLRAGKSHVAAVILHSHWLATEHSRVCSTTPSAYLLLGSSQLDEQPLSEVTARESQTNNVLELPPVGVVWSLCRSAIMKEEEEPNTILPAKPTTHHDSRPGQSTSLSLMPSAKRLGCVERF